MPYYLIAHARHMDWQTKLMKVHGPFATKDDTRQVVADLDTAEPEVEYQLFRSTEGGLSHVENGTVHAGTVLKAVMDGRLTRAYYND